MCYLYNIISFHVLYSHSSLFSSSASLFTLSNSKAFIEGTSNRTELSDLNATALTIFNVSDTANNQVHLQL